MKSRQELYFMLARFWGWTFEEIMNCTPEQLNFLCEKLAEESKNQNGDRNENMMFSTREEWRLWRELNGKSRA